METIQFFSFKSKVKNFNDNVSVYLQTFFRSTKQKNGQNINETGNLRKLKYLIETNYECKYLNRYC